MSSSFNSSFISYFSMLKDLRQQGKILHRLVDILFIAVAAFIAGADDWEIVIAVDCQVKLTHMYTLRFYGHLLVNSVFYT